MGGTGDALPSSTGSSAVWGAGAWRTAGAGAGAEEGVGGAIGGQAAAARRGVGRSVPGRGATMRGIQSGAAVLHLELAARGWLTLKAAEGLRP